MTNSLKIGDTLTSLILGSDDLKEQIGSKVYPIVANEGTTYPFVIYKRTSDLSSGCKDGYYEDEVEFEIDVVSVSYAEGIDIAHNIRKILEKQKISTDLMTLYDCHMTNAYEDYTDEVFVQKMTYITKID